MYPLLIYGQTGSGKSYYAQSLTNNYILISGQDDRILNIFDIMENYLMHGNNRFVIIDNIDLMTENSQTNLVKYLEKYKNFILITTSLYSVSQRIIIRCHLHYMNHIDRRIKQKQEFLKSININTDEQKSIDTIDDITDTSKLINQLFDYALKSKNYKLLNELSIIELQEHHKNISLFILFKQLNLHHFII